jgi:hypothetical protein
MFEELPGVHWPFNIPRMTLMTPEARQELLHITITQPVPSRIQFKLSESFFNGIKKTCHRVRIGTTLCLRIPDSCIILCPRTFGSLFTGIRALSDIRMTHRDPETYLKHLLLAWYIYHIISGLSHGVIPSALTFVCACRCCVDHHFSVIPRFY